MFWGSAQGNSRARVPEEPEGLLGLWQMGARRVGSVRVVGGAAKRGTETRLAAAKVCGQ